MKRWIIKDEQTGAILRQGYTTDNTEVIYCGPGEQIFEDIVNNENTQQPASV